MNNNSHKHLENETELLLSKVSASELLNILDDGILIVNNQYEIVFYNKAMERIEGLTFDQVKGMKIPDVFPEQTYNNSTIMQTIKEGKPFRNILQTYHTILGRKVTTLNTTLPLYENGVIIGAIEIARDISTIKEMSLKLMDLQKEVLSINKGLRTRSSKDRFTFDSIIGNNSLIKNSIEISKKASLTISPVLLLGETGTGKELFAQSIHNYSKRQAKPFLAVNCAALPEGLLEGILFGTVPGGFTDAIDRPGIFEQANGGTVLLDEVNSMSLPLQSKLLRILEEKKVQRVGGIKEIDLDLKIISTSNIDLRDQVAKGNFREDLFYRLNVVSVEIPPLRDRKDDLPLLINHFLDYYNNLFGKNVISLSDELMETFNEYDWPGNVRELKHCIESGMNLIDNSDSILRPEHIPGFAKNINVRTHIKTTQQRKTNSVAINLNQDLSKLEKKRIIEAIIKNNGNITKAAQMLGLKRQTLSYKMKRLNIAKDDFVFRYNQT
jgi:arginine utilization regulatory protein